MPGFNLSANTLIASLIWGAVGSGFTVYGFKQKDMIAALGGVALGAGSYFIGSALVMSLVSVAVIVVVFWLKKFY